MTESARVYSYLRFSDPRQSDGHSAERQLTYAREWAASKGLLLDDSLSLRDEGLSAYHQKHVKRGALGAFLVAIDEGRIPKGSVLVVEGLDRLSRAEPIQAQAQLAQIINAGITVVTASDGREYNRQVLKDQPMELVYSLLVMIRAHEESATKSKRVAASIRRQCEAWQAGQYRGVIRNGKDPSWVAWNGEAFELVPDRAAAVRRALSLYREGYGYIKIAEMLEHEGLQLNERKANSQHIYRIIKAETLVGIKTLSVEGETYRLEGYYPRILTDQEWQTLQHLASTRRRQKSNSEIPGVITGLGVSYCGYCGAAMTGLTMHSRRRQDGTMAQGHRRLMCSAYSTNGGCEVSGSCMVGPVEMAVMRFCSDEMNLVHLLAGNDEGEKLQAQLVTQEQRLAEKRQKAERLAEALAVDDEAAPLAIIRKVRTLESEAAALEKSIQATRAALGQVASSESPALADEWAALLDGVEALDTTARMAARQLVADTFAKIVIYKDGIRPVKKSRTLDLLLVAKSGTSRRITVNRRTGEWQAGAIMTAGQGE